METWVILAALEQELVPVARALGLPRSRDDHQLFLGRDEQREIVARYTGMGAYASTIGLKKAMENRNVTRLLHIGFAGGLDPALAPGDLLQPKWIVHDTGHVLLLGTGVPSVTTSKPEQRIAAQTLLTSEALAGDVRIKTELRKRFAAAAVEMECFHVGKMAIEKRLHLTVLRAISDPADMALPREVTQWVREDGSSNTSAAMGYLALRPWKLPMLLALGSHAARASAALVRGARTWVGAGDVVATPNVKATAP